mgnify:CR=1 FL=1
MIVTIQCFAQLARAAGGADHELDLDNGATAQDALRLFANGSSDETRALLFNEAGEHQPTILLFLDEEPVLFSEPAVMSERSILFIATPIAGG